MASLKKNAAFSSQAFLAVERHLEGSMLPIDWMRGSSPFFPSLNTVELKGLNKLK